MQNNWGEGAQPPNEIQDFQKKKTITTALPEKKNKQVKTRFYEFWVEYKKEVIKGIQKRKEERILDLN